MTEGSTLDEAIALSFGKEPEVVNWQKIEPLKDKTVFAKLYAKRRDLALRVTRWKAFSNTIPPVIFISWAKQIKLDLPIELINELAKIGSVAVDWREKFNALEIAHNELLKNSKNVNLGTTQKTESILKPESTRKIDNLLQAIAGVAIYGYKHDVNSERSNASQDLSDDISKTGKTIDTKTIRGWIREGIALLPAKPHKN